MNRRVDLDGRTRQVRIGRQGIYDRDGVLAGHELLFRGLSATSAGLGHDHLGHTAALAVGAHGSDREAGDYATSQLIATTFGDFGVDQLGGGLPLYLNLTRAFLVGELPLPFGPDGVVLEILEDVVVDAELHEGLRHLRSRGFQIALDDFVGEPERQELLGDVDVVKIDVLALERPLAEVVAVCRARAPGARLLAEKIETEAMLRTCLDSGFELFQGYHFQRPVTLETSRMSPTHSVCLRLLRALVDPSASTADIEAVVAQDPGLTLRVLRSANSASVASRGRITSLRQAVVLLGPPALTAWVTLTMLGGLTPGSRDDLVTVLARASCCESLDGQIGGSRASGSTAYLAGMLSGIAQIMRSDVAEVAHGAGVDPNLVAHLTNGTGSVGAVVATVVAHETGKAFSTTLPNLTESDVSLAYLRSWSEALAQVGDVLDS